MNQDKISVIVPVHNTERLLEECVISIISQSLRNIELLIIDDGSTDNSGIFTDKFALEDSRIKVFHTSNKGVSAARNLGIEKASGDYISFVDSDDLLLPDSLENLHDMIKSANADIAEGKIVRNINGVKKKIIHNTKILTGKEAVKNYLYQKDLSSSVCGKLFKKSLFKGVKFKEGLRYEDLEIIHKLYAKCKKVVYLYIPVYYYNNRPDSFINNWSSSRLDVLTVTKDIEDYMDKNYPECLAAARDRRLSANFNIFCLALKNNETQIADECWDFIKKYRLESLSNQNVRIKNKIGVLLSYFGKSIFKGISKFYCH